MNAVAVCDYGAGNTRSVRAALTALGVHNVLTSDPDVLMTSPSVVLPGVGSARHAMAHLTRTGAATALRERFLAGRPLFGICLGMQLALEYSDEDGGVVTLGLVEGTTRRLDLDRSPRLGWSMVDPWGLSFYFAHGYGCDTPSVVATSEGVTAAVRAGSFFGVQFHPEKSGHAGREWLGQCLSRA